MPAARIAAAAAAIALVAALAGCSSGDDDSASSPDAATTAAPAATATAPATEGIVPLEAVGAQTIEARPFADWVLVAFGRAWVTGVDQGIASYDVTSGRLIGSAPVRGVPCGAPDDGFGALWVPTCENRAIHKVDPASGRVTASIPVNAPAMGEYTIGAGEGGVWTITDTVGCVGCRLARIDPDVELVNDRFPVPAGGASVRAGLGAVWIAYPDEGRLLRVNPANGRIVARIPVGDGPRFMDVGAGAVWVMNQGDGSVSRVDPGSNRVVATIPVDLAIEGGDLTVGAGSVWVRATEELVARIDPATNRVVARIGEPAGSGSASAGDGQLWASAHDAFAVYRIPIEAIPGG